MMLICYNLVLYTCCQLATKLLCTRNIWMPVSCYFPGQEYIVLRYKQTVFFCLFITGILNLFRSVKMTYSHIIIILQFFFVTWLDVADSVHTKMPQVFFSI